MTVEALKLYTSNYKLGPCPICGGESRVLVGPGENGMAVAVIACQGGPSRDGGNTYCGAKLDGAIGEDAYVLQLMRWNRGLR